jgi:hypothetical protein
MCQTCVDIEKQIDEYRAVLSSATDRWEIERINGLIYQLDEARVRLHENPQRI